MSINKMELSRNTFYNEPQIKIPLFSQEKEIVIDCETSIPLKCVIKYRKNIIYKIDWIGMHQKPEETFSYRKKDGKTYIYVSEFYYSGMGTKTDKKLECII
jgi:hypothetical protein